MADMLVKLYHIAPAEGLEQALGREGIRLKRAIAPDKSKIEAFARTCAGEDYADEVCVAMSRTPSTCYIATKGRELVGFACFETTAKNFFGPMAVREDCRRRGIGRALLLRSLASMREMGYAYAVIGWPAKTAVPFYETCVQATWIEDETPGLYGQLVDRD